MLWACICRCEVEKDGKNFGNKDLQSTYLETLFAREENSHHLLNELSSGSPFPSCHQV